MKTIFTLTFTGEFDSTQAQEASEAVGKLRAAGLGTRFVSNVGYAEQTDKGTALAVAQKAAEPKQKAPAAPAKKAAPKKAKKPVVPAAPLKNDAGPLVKLSVREVIDQLKDLPGISGAGWQDRLALEISATGAPASQPSVSRWASGETVPVKSTVGVIERYYHKMTGRSNVRVVGSR